MNMIHKPSLAKCDNRNIKAKKHPYSGDPEDWLSNELLSKFNISAVSFDFFINWSDNTTSSEIWIKRIVDRNVQTWPIADNEMLLKWIYDCDSEQAISDLSYFCGQNNLKLNYFLFKDVDWNNSDGGIVNVTLDNEGNLVGANQISIEELKERIKSQSGGNVSVGRKGLFYGLSTLECYLSKTDAAWPGDLDILLLDDNKDPLAIIELKKHTLGSSINNQKLSNYYPSKDARKYDRLAIFRNYLQTSHDLPIIVLYYPTNTNENLIKLEKIDGNVGNLKSGKSLVLELPNIKEKMKLEEFHKSLLGVIME